MNFVYGELSKFAPTYYDEMEREDDGSIDLTSTSIVYKLEGSSQTADVSSREYVPLTIDIWYTVDDELTVESMAYDIDGALKDRSIVVENKAFKMLRDTNYYMNIPDDSLNIRRKRLRYLIRYYNH